MKESAFYTDACFDHLLIEERLAQIARILADERSVVVPFLGEAIQLGTGLAELNVRAPAVYKLICDRIGVLADHFGSAYWSV